MVQAETAGSSKSQPQPTPEIYPFHFLLLEISPAKPLNQQTFVKKPPPRWTKKGVHNLLQVRTQLLNEELNQTFHKWYPGMKPQKVSKSESAEEKRAA